MPAIDQVWFIYLVIIAMSAFAFSLGLVCILDQDPSLPPAE